MNVKINRHDSNASISLSSKRRKIKYKNIYINNDNGWYYSEFMNCKQQNGVTIIDIVRGLYVFLQINSKVLVN